MGRRPKPRLPGSEGIASASMPAFVSSPVHGEWLLSEGAKTPPVESLVLTEITSPSTEKIDPLPPSTVQETAESQPKRKSKSTEWPNPSKLQKQCNGEVRRSRRLRNAVIPITNPSPDSEPLTIASDENVEILQLCDKKQVLLPSSTENNFESKFGWLEKQVEALLSSMNALHSKVQELSISGCTHHADADNRTSHLDCRKEIDELMIVNSDLTSKLEVAQNKVELYERRQRLFGDVLDKLKNTIMLFELSKTAEQLP